MEGLRKIVYQSKEIYYVDYSNFKLNKEKAIELVKTTAEEWLTQPYNLVLSLVNLSGFSFDSDVISVFKECEAKTAPFEKKMAVIGINSLQLLAFNFVVNFSTKNIIKINKNATDAKEWLIKD